MASLYSKDLFILSIDISTSKVEVSALLEKQFIEIETSVLPYITYNALVPIQVSEVKKMIAYFTYFEFSKVQSTINTSSGMVSLAFENGIKLIDSNKNADAWNNGVDLFNKYVTDINNKLGYINSFGI